MLSFNWAKGFTCDLNLWLIIPLDSFGCRVMILIKLCNGTELAKPKGLFFRITWSFNSLQDSEFWALVYRDFVCFSLLRAGKQYWWNTPWKFRPVGGSIVRFWKYWALRSLPVLAAFPPRLNLHRLLQTPPSTPSPTSSGPANIITHSCQVKLKWREMS